MNMHEVFEPEVYEHFGYGVNGAAVSQAISLKRIADVLEKLAAQEPRTITIRDVTAALIPPAPPIAELRKQNAASPKR